MEFKNLKTKFLGRNMLHFEVIDSTQKYIKENSIKNMPNGTIVIADTQSSGIGTQGRKWFTGDNNENIAMSFVLYPETDIKKFSNLTKLIAECIINTVKKLYGYELKIKVPNDIICNEKKIAGILTESSSIGEKVKKIIIGIGFNVNQMEFPEDLKDLATSLKKEFSKNFSKEEIIVEFLNEFELVYLKLLDNK
ncbi:MAG TPA: biotin--[acetyl-CoA-carboxylase] ligase [Candidatus Scatovivens faecipullorum]|jgi:biotin--[acetyl-coA-carboxylase] ligase|nr:biotin--[acetyl-CoA-carboxylase] ligase [Candidatus Scatovivens faecipullorum]